MMKEIKWLTYDPLGKIPIKFKLPLAFGILFLIAFGIGGYFIITSVYQILEKEVMIRLENESIAHAMLFEKKTETLMARAEDFSSDGLIRSSTELLVAAQKGSKEYGEVFSILQDHLTKNKLPLISEFIDLQIYDLQWDKLISLNHNVPVVSKNMFDFDTGYTVAYSGIMRNNEEESDTAITAIATRLWDVAHEKNVGWLVCFVDLSKIIEDYLIDNLELENSNESQDKVVSIVDKNGSAISLLLNSSNRDSQNSFSIGPTQKISSSGIYNLVNHEGRHLCKNGESMFGQSFPLKSAGWQILVELKAADVLKPISRLESKLLGIILIIFILAIASLYFPIQFVIRPLGRLQKMASKIKEGNFSERVETNSEDEIGSLSKTLNLMAEAVEERTINLEESKKRLSIQHDRLKTIIDSMNDGLILLNHDGEIVLQNDASKNMVDILLGDNKRFDIHLCDKNYCDSETCLDCLKDSGKNRACILNIGEKKFEVVTTDLPSYDNKGGKILLSRDITEREKIYERHIHQERLVFLGKTAAVVAHEMNSPLTAISMYNQMMERELPKESVFNEHVKVIKRNIDTCQQFIKELLEFSSIPKPNISNVDVHDIIKNVSKLIGSLTKDRKVSIDLKLEATDYTFLGDSSQCRQVFTNLIQNAVQAINDNEGNIKIKSYNNENNVIIDIIDNGTGIDEEIQPHIFDPFYSTKQNQGGTGLGLSVAKRVIDAHGGELNLVESNTGRTVFRITFPTSSINDDKSIVEMNSSSGN